MQHIFLALTNPVFGAEASFNMWYDRSHVPEVLRYGRGFVGCRRYKFYSEAGGHGLRPWDYLALYDLECDNLPSLSESSWIEGAPPLTPFRGLVKDDHVAWVYTPCGSRVTRGSAHDDPRLHTAGYLRLQWRRDRDATEEGRLAEILIGSDAYVSARAYVLADAQRRNQHDSPWGSLVVYEMRELNAPGSANSDAEWIYGVVSGYVTRASVLASKAM